MLSRRDFLKNSAALATGGAFLPLAFPETPSSRPVGLQLYTLSKAMDNDAAGTLKKVAAIGFNEVESAFTSKERYYGMNPREFKAIVRDSGLHWRSHHVSGAPFKTPDGQAVRNLKENYKELVDEAAEGGLRYLVCAGSPIDTLDAIRSTIEVLERTSEECNKSGLKLAYHNHVQEFEEVEGEQPYHLLLSQTDASSLQMELDLAWATKAGINPVELFKKYPGRFPLWHVKDISKDFSTLQPVGEGSIDFAPIFAESKRAGLKHFFIEHDAPADPFGSITTSFSNVGRIIAPKK